MGTEKENLSLYLKELRLVKNMTLRDVEKATNKSVSNAYLSQLESGRIAKPSPHILQELAKVYRVPYEDIMVVAGYMKVSNKKISTKKGGVVFYNRKGITDSEKAELLRYLEFIRRKRKNKNNEKR